MAGGSDDEDGGGLRGRDSELAEEEGSMSLLSEVQDIWPRLRLQVTVVDFQICNSIVTPDVICSNEVKGRNADTKTIEKVQRSVLVPLDAAPATPRCREVELMVAVDGGGSVDGG